MSNASVELEELQQLYSEITASCDNLRNTKRVLLSTYEQLSRSWDDRKYGRLGTIIEDCQNAIEKILSALLQAQKTLAIMVRYVAKYEGVSLNGGSVSSGNPGTNVPPNRLSSKTTIEKIKSWIGEINPNYYKQNVFSPRGNPYRVNCGSCAFAVESRLNGSNPTAVASSVNIGTDSEMESVTGRSCVYMPVSDIEQHLRTMGAGAHLIVGINRHCTPLGLPQAGHWFNAFYDGNNIYTIDGQTGSIYDWPHDYIDVSEWCVLI